MVSCARSGGSSSSTVSSPRRGLCSIMQPMHMSYIFSMACLGEISPSGFSLLIKPKERSSSKLPSVAETACRCPLHQERPKLNPAWHTTSSAGQVLRVLSCSSRHPEVPRQQRLIRYAANQVRIALQLRSQFISGVAAGAFLFPCTCGRPPAAWPANQSSAHGKLMSS